MKELQAIRRDVMARLRTVPAVLQAINRVADQPTYIRYLSEVAAQYASHSPIVMTLAASRCMNSHPELACYLLHHAEEERGHNEWALQDLQDLKASKQLMTKCRPVPGCAAMVANNYYVATQGNPVALFGWMYVLEAIGADLGGELGKNLKATFKHPSRFVAGHGKADLTHVKEIESHIQKFVRSAQDKADVIYVAQLSAVFYVQMLRELME